MVIRDNADGSVTLVRQNDHARLSGRLAQHWGNGAWHTPRPLPEVALGAELHDLAWVAWDQEAISSGARPLAFYEVPRTTTAPMYRRGIDAVEQIDAYAGLLASLHYSGLFTSHWGWQPLANVARMTTDERSAVELLLAHELQRQQRLREQLKPDEVVLERAYKCLQLWDRISLDICRHDFTEGWEGEYPAIDGTTLTIRLTSPDRCILAPYPLNTDPLTEQVPAATLGTGGEHSIDIVFTSA